MRRFLLLALAVACLSGCVSTHPLIGRWKTVDNEGHEAALIFKPDQALEALSRGETLTGHWTFNEDTEPCRLELTFEEQSAIVTIAKLEGDQLLIEPREEDDELPTQFTSKAQKYRRQ